MRNVQTKILKFREKNNIKQKFVVRNFQNLGIPLEVVFYSGNSGKCCSIRHREFAEILKQEFWAELKAPTKAVTYLQNLQLTQTICYIIVKYHDVFFT